MDEQFNQELESAPPAHRPWWKTPAGLTLSLVIVVALLWGFYVVGTTSTEPTTQELSLDLAGLEEQNAQEDQTSEQPADGDRPDPGTQGQTSPASQDTATPSPSQSAAPVRTVESSGAFKLSSKSAFSCTAEAPSDWTMESTAESQTADLFAPGKSMYAGYGIQAVNTQLAPFSSAYSPPLNDSDLYSEDPATVAKAYGKIVVGSLGGNSGLSFTGEHNQAVGDYQLRSVQSSTHKGVIYYHRNGIPGDGINYSYILPMYFAFTKTAAWDQSGLLVARIAASIKCNVQLVQHSGPVVEAQTSGTGSSSDSNGSADGYNPQLGTEYVHDSSTGENYLVSPSSNWSSDGPDGAGYYKQSGNDYTKLTPGRSD